MIKFEDLGPAAQEELAKMTGKQRLFVKYLVEGKNQVDAYEAAFGIRSENSRKKASAEVRKKSVQVVLEEIRLLAAKEFAVDEEKIIKAYAEMAFADVRDFFDENGNLIPIKNLPRHLASLVLSFDQEEITVGTGQERQVIGALKRVKLINRKDALDSLARTQGLFAAGRQATEKTKARIVRLPTKVSEEDWNKKHAQGK